MHKMISTRTAILSAAILVSFAAFSLRAEAQASPQTQEKAQNQSAAKAASKPVYTPAESGIIAEIKTLRSTPGLRARRQNQRHRRRDRHPSRREQ